MPRGVIHIHLSHILFCRIQSVPDQQCHAPYPSGSDKTWHFLSCSRTCRPCACCLDRLPPRPLADLVAIGVCICQCCMCQLAETLWQVNPLNPELNPICNLLALLAHHFLHVSRIRVKSLTLRLLMSYIYIYIYIYIWSAYS